MRLSLPDTVMITGARAPVALHLARLLKAAGHRVIAADSLQHTLTAASGAIDHYARLPAPKSEIQAYADALQSLIGEHRIGIVIPTCEEVFYLAQVWRNRDMGADLFTAGWAELRDAHHKYRFIQTCAAMGWRVPETVLLDSPGDVHTQLARAHTLVFKPVWSRFASHVLIRPSPRRAARIRPSPDRPWVAQDHITGEEISVYAVAQQGRVCAVSAYRGLYRAGPGAAVVFEPVQDAQVTRFVQCYVDATQWTGQISFDLIRREDGTVWPIECNPRTTSGVHFFSDGPAFARCLAGGAPQVAPDVTGPMGVRLAMWIYGFPQAVRRRALGRFRQIAPRVQDVLDWPGDPAPANAQWRALREIAGIAIRERISLQRASTRDIEWDGDHNSIS